MVTVGIDNGSTGSVGIFIDQNPPTYFSIPTQDCLHYGKDGRIEKRLSRLALARTLVEAQGNRPNSEVRVYLERPYTGKFLNATLPAHRFFEATLCTLEDLELGYQVVDSRDWQPVVLGKIKGSAELKHASKLRGVQLFPHLREIIERRGDADGLLIAYRWHAVHLT